MIATIDMNVGRPRARNLAIVTSNIGLWRWHEKPGVTPDAPGFVRRGSRRCGVLAWMSASRTRRMRARSPHSMRRCLDRAGHPGTPRRAAGLRRRRTGRSILGLEGGRQHRQDSRDAERFARLSPRRHRPRPRSTRPPAPSRISSRWIGHARDYARSGQKLLASDLIFSNGYELTTAAAAAVEDAQSRGAASL